MPGTVTEQPYFTMVVCGALTDYEKAFRMVEAETDEAPAPRAARDAVAHVSAMTAEDELRAQGIEI